MNFWIMLYLFGWCVIAVYEDYMFRECHDYTVLNGLFLWIGLLFIWPWVLASEMKGRYRDYCETNL